MGKYRLQAAPPSGPRRAAKRSVVFAPNRIDAHLTTYAYADGNCTTPLLELKFGGNANIKGSSDVADGALNMDLILNDYLTVTPQLGGLLNSADPGTCSTEAWAVGTEQDVLATGCSVMGVAANTPKA